MKKKNLIILIILLLIIDQTTKTIVTTQMEQFQRIEIIPNFFRILYIRNTGAAFSILEGQMGFLYLVTIISFVVIFFLYKDAKTKLAYIATSIFLAGTIGNFIDRVIYQSVIDMFSFSFGSYNFAIFNFADVFITVGISLLFIEQILNYLKERKV